MSAAGVRVAVAAVTVGAAQAAAVAAMRPVMPKARVVHPEARPRPATVPPVQAAAGAAGIVLTTSHRATTPTSVRMVDTACHPSAIQVVLRSQILCVPASTAWRTVVAVVVAEHAAGVMAAAEVAAAEVAVAAVAAARAVPTGVNPKPALPMCNAGFLACAVRAYLFLGFS